MAIALKTFIQLLMLQLKKISMKILTKTTYQRITTRTENVMLILKRRALVINCVKMKCPFVASCMLWLGYWRGLIIRTILWRIKARGNRSHIRDKVKEWLQIQDCVNAKEKLPTQVEQVWMVLIPFKNISWSSILTIIAYPMRYQSP